MSQIEDKIKVIHGNDKEQLEIILSEERRVIVEASAGCGKTKTLVSKIAYLLSNNLIASNKKILALTFGVNAAYKIKKEAFEKIPTLIDDIKNLENKILVTNFHGFSRKILGKYGYLLHDNLLKLNEFIVVDDSSTENLTKLNIGIFIEEGAFLSEYSKRIKENDRDYMNKNFDQYIDLIIRKLLPNKYITYNAILMLTLKLLYRYNQILKFYQKLFPYIIIDEFQDTGILSWTLLRLIITPDTMLLFMGDPLQRIYGFIGAVPNLMEIACSKYNMKMLKISTNYRFKNNNEMLLLDRNIRENSKNSSALIANDATVPCNLYRTQAEEAKYVASKLKVLLGQTSESKIAILTQSRTKNLQCILEYLTYCSIDYFNGLFSEESATYKTFHIDTFKIFISTYEANKSKTINKSLLSKVYDKISALYENRQDDEIISLKKLLKVFFNNILANKSFLNNEEKYELITDVLSNNSLKQSMEYLEERVVVTTIHGAKGLEWDYVLIPDMERNSFPNYKSLCSYCSEISNTSNCNKCIINDKCMDKHFFDKYIEILSIFYVAVTRARKQVFFSASLETLNNSRYLYTKYSCLLSIPGIQLCCDRDIA